MKFAYADRSKYLGDPDFYDVPIKKITSKKYANDINKNIQIGKLTPVNEINPGKYMDGEAMKQPIFL